MFVMLITYNKQHTQHETGEQYRDLGDGTGELREKERERESRVARWYSFK
jgi:hypothetical protein